MARSAPLLRDLHLASREAYARLADSGEDLGLVQKGLLMLCKTQHALDEEAAFAERARSLGVPAEVLTAEQTSELDPGATFSITGAVHFPKDCHLVPEKYLASLERRFLAGGGTLRAGTSVEGCIRSGSKIHALQTSAGAIEAEEFILCAGVWSAALFHSLGLRLPMQAGKGYSLTLGNPVELPNICSILTEARVAVTPMGSSLRVGGTMELSGVNARVNPRRVQGIVEALPRYYPAFKSEHFAGIDPWHGLRPCSPDGLPYLGRAAAAENLIVATGHAMMGLSLAPATGEIAANFVDHAPVAESVKLLHPDRFA